MTTDADPDAVPPGGPTLTVGAMLIPQGMAYAALAGILALLVVVLATAAVPVLGLDGAGARTPLASIFSAAAVLFALLLLDLSGVPSADLSGARSLASLDDACREHGVELHLGAGGEGVLATLRRADLDTRFAARSHEDPSDALVGVATRDTAPVVG